MPWLSQRDVRKGHLSPEYSNFRASQRHWARLIYRPLQYMVDSGPRWEPLLWMASGANTSQFFVLRLYQLNPGPQRFLCVTMTRTKRKFGCPHRQEYPVSRLRHVAQPPP